MPPKNRKASFATKVYKGPAKMVGHFLPDVTRPVFEKFGAHRAALMADWDTIIGAPLCHFTAPEQIKWNGSKRNGDAVELMEAPNPATLVVRVEGPAALEVQHQAPQLMQRINDYFGAKVIGDIRILQAPLDKAPPEADVKRVDLNKPIENEDFIAGEDAELSQALKRLWRGIQARKGG